MSILKWTEKKSVIGLYICRVGWQEIGISRWDENIPLVCW